MKKTLLTASACVVFAGPAMACEWNKMKVTTVPAEETVAMSTAPEAPVDPATVLVPAEPPVATN